MKVSQIRAARWAITGGLAAFLAIAAAGFPMQADAFVCNGQFDLLQKGYCSTTTTQGCGTSFDAACPAGETCKTFNFFDPGDPEKDGADQLRVSLAVGTSTITGPAGAPDNMTVHKVRFDLDCVQNSGGNGTNTLCMDQGDVVEYTGDATISTDCPGVTWTSSQPLGGVGANEVVFTPSAPIVIPQSCAPSQASPPPACGGCKLEFGVRVVHQEAAGSDTTPQLVEEAAGYIQGQGDAVCNERLTGSMQSGSTQTANMPICPSCTIDQCNLGCDEQVTGECTPQTASTPCADTDGNSCTTAGCELSPSDSTVGVCVQTHLLASNNTPCGTDEDTTDCLLPACVSGVCEQKTIPDTNKVNMPCTSTPDTPNNCLVPCCDGTGVCAESSSAAQANPTGCAVPDSTPCTDSDGNACTTAGCNGQGVCDQNHASKTCPPADECNKGCDSTSGQCTPQTSTPCTDTDGNACTTAGCEVDGTNPELGVCVQSHLFASNSTPCADTDGSSCTMAGCNGQGVCDQTHVSNCQQCPNAFTGLNLGAASNFAVLGLSGAHLIISEGATKIVGDVGAGPHDTGTLLKSTIVGQLFIDPTAVLDIHSDLTVTGGIVIQDLTQADADARAASMDAAGFTPTQTLGNINSSTTITGGGGLNVISIDSVNLVKQTLTIAGSASDIFIFNVTGDYIFNGSQMVLSGGVTANHILWNFPTAGSDIEFFTPVAVAFGTFLAPQRGFIQDHGDLEGAAIAGGTLKFHSAALVNFCPQS